MIWRRRIPPALWRGEGVLDRIEVGIGGQEQQPFAGGFDGVSDREAVVGGQVVRDHDVSGLQGRSPHLLDMGQPILHVLG